MSCRQQCGLLQVLLPLSLHLATLSESYSADDAIFQVYKLTVATVWAY